MSTGVPMWLQVLQGLLTPTIAVVATYVAWQQWKGNETKLRLDRYEHRLAIYREVMTLISSIVREAKCSIPELLTFRSKTFEAEFLFGADIPQYIEEVFQRGLKLHTANAQYRESSQPTPPDYDHMKVVEASETQLDWFIAQPALATAMFKRYLSVT